MYETKEVLEKVILVAVSTGKEEDAAESLDELEELAKTACGTGGRESDTESGTCQQCHICRNRQGAGNKGTDLGNRGRGSYL